MKFHVISMALVLFSVTGLRAQEKGVRTFSVRIVDRTNDELLPFVEVQLEGSTISALTDENGVVSLDIPVNHTGERCYLTITYVGYEPLRYRVPRSNKGRLRTIELRRVKFDMRDPPVIRYSKDGPPPLIGK
jgi:hypothetical protein